jgi:general secretion pathway protein B
MSYILDALKRADSEREREREDVPGLHSKTDPWIAPDEVRTRRQQPQALIWALAVAGLLSVLGGLWFVLMREATPTAVPGVASPAQSAPVPVASVVVPQPVPAAAPQPVLVVVAPPAAPIPPPAAPPIPPPAPVARSVAVAPAPSPARQARAAEPAATPPPAVAAPAKLKAEALVAPAALTKEPVVPAPTASAATSAEARLYTLNELPEAVRAGLPVLSVGGAMYSQTPANRMLIINGQVFREGDTLAPGLVLEQIKLKSAVLKVKGLRYGISF